MIARVLTATLLLLFAPPGADSVAAQARIAFAVRPAPATEGWRPLVDIPDLLSDPVLQEALSSGLPLRFHLRVELWERSVFDRLAEAQEISVAILQDPLERIFRLETAGSSSSLTSVQQARTALRSILNPSLQPRERGRFYYLASLEVETLSLSDLDELRRWMRGEAQPAVEGRTPAGRALGRGLRRVFIRLLGLPTRRFEARSAAFVLQ